MHASDAGTRRAKVDQGRWVMGGRAMVCPHVNRRVWEIGWIHRHFQKRPISNSYQFKKIERHSLPALKIFFFSRYMTNRNAPNFLHFYGVKIQYSYIITMAK